MNRKQCKPFFLVIFLFFSQYVSSSGQFGHAFAAFSGGYGKIEDSYQNTGTSGIIRVAFGSLVQVHPSIHLGAQIGFQTSTQFRLNNDITLKMGSSTVPVFETTKTPIDFLFINRYELYKPLFFQVKGGVALITSTATGADLQTGVNWLPEVQAGMGINIYKRSRFTLSYQQFFGTTPIITPLDITQGTYKISGSPTWRGVLLAFEHDL